MRPALRERTINTQPTLRNLHSSTHNDGDDDVDDDDDDVGDDGEYDSNGDRTNN